MKFVTEVKSFQRFREEGTASGTYQEYISVALVLIIVVANQLSIFSQVITSACT